MDTRTPPYFFEATAYFVPPLLFTVLFTLLEELVLFFTTLVIAFFTLLTTLETVLLTVFTTLETVSATFFTVELTELDELEELDLEEELLDVLEEELVIFCLVSPL